MTNSSHGTDVNITLQNPNRRRILQWLALAALSVVPVLSLGGAVDAGKRQRKQRRRKKSKRNQLPTPTVRADATCPGPQTNGFILAPRGVLAQSFTAGQTGLLVRAELELQHQETVSATGNLFLRLAPLVDAFPGPNALVSAQVAASSVATGTSVISFAFTDPAPVKAGTSYALVLSRDGDGSIAWSNRSGAACDGRSFVTADITVPLEARNDLDLIFTTFVQV